MPTVEETLIGLNNLDPTLVAGLLVNTRIPDAPVDGDHLRRALDARGLDGSLVPATRNEVFDFQNACRSVATKRGKNFSGGVRVEVGEVTSNATECVYQITHATVDKLNRVIDHAKEMRVVYSKTSASNGLHPIHVEMLEADRSSMQPIIDAIEFHFQIHKGRQPGAKVRAIVRDLLRSMDAVRWSSTNSVWFVPISQRTHLEKLHSAIAEVYTSDSAHVEFDMIPLPNTEGIGAMVEDKIVLNARSEAAKLGQEIADKLAGGGNVKQETFAAIANRRREIDAYVKRMNSRLQREIDIAGSAMHLLDEQLMEMMGRIK